MRKSFHHVWRALALALLLLACDEPPDPHDMPSFGDAGAESERSGPQFAVVSSDWSATSISLLDVHGELLADDYLTSGSAQAGLVTALSGDVALPTRSGEPGVLVVIDRYKTDVITRVRLSDAHILGQLKTHTPPGQGSTSAASSNPQDYLALDARSAWVSRFEPNLDPDVPARDRGNDLLRIDPGAMKRTDERIDLSSLDGTGTRTDPDTGEDEQVLVYARPSALVKLGDTLVVGLARISFDYSAVGSGMVGLVALDSRKVTGVALSEFASCAELSYVPEAADRVLVACSGDVAAGARATAGFALLQVDGTSAEVLARWRAQDHAEAPVFDVGVSLGGSLVAAVASDFSGTGPDVFAVLDLDTGEHTPLLENRPGSGSLGSPYYDAATGLLLLPDASVDGDQRASAGVRRFLRKDDGSFEQLAVVPVAVSTTLPVRHVYAL